MTKLEKAAKVRFSQGLDASFEDSLNYVSTFPESQLKNLANIFDEEQAIREFAQNILSKYNGSGKTVKEAVKENIETIKERYSITEFMKVAIDNEKIDRDQIL